MLDNFEVQFQRELMVNDSTFASFNLMKETFQFQTKVWLWVKMFSIKASKVK